MKRRIALSIALTLSVALVSLMSSDSTANAQQGGRRFSFATGAVTPGAGQILRVTVVGTDASDTLRVRFRWTQYMAAGCSGMPAVCRQTVASQGATPLTTLDAGEALSFDVGLGSGDGAFNVVAETNNRDVRVLSIVFDTSTQRVVSFTEARHAGYLN